MVLRLVLRDFLPRDFLPRDFLPRVLLPRDFLPRLRLIPFPFFPFLEVACLFTAGGVADFFAAAGGGTNVEIPSRGRAAAGEVWLPFFSSELERGVAGLFLSDVE